MHTKRHILAALTVGLIMTFASSVLAQSMSEYQGQNHQEGHEGHEGHHGHMRYQQSPIDASVSDHLATGING